MLLSDRIKRINAVVGPIEESRQDSLNYHLELLAVDIVTAIQSARENGYYSGYLDGGTDGCKACHREGETYNWSDVVKRNYMNGYTAGWVEGREQLKKMLES